MVLELHFEWGDLQYTTGSNIYSAIEILKNAGCKEIFIFGSLVSGTYREDSDIDIAIKGCSAENYFALLGQLLTTLSRPVDLINLDREDSFSRYLEKAGDLHRVS